MADGNQMMLAKNNPWISWVKRSAYPALRKNPAKAPISVVDLFCGCGGMTLGAAEAARQLNTHLDIRLAVDFDPSAIDVLRANFKLDGDVAICADVQSILSGNAGDPFDSRLKKLIRRVGDLDLLVAGPPCQGNSDLNNKSRRSDPRNALYMTAIRAVESFSPRLAIIENVPSVVHDKRKVVKRAESSLRSMGYNVAQLVVQMTDYGVAQSRKRHVTLASKELTSEALAVLARPSVVEISTVADFIEGIEDEPTQKIGSFYATTKVSRANAERMQWLFENDEYDLPDYLRPACHRDNPHSYRSMYGRMYWNRPSQTITTGFGSMGQGRYVHPTRSRTITCHEAARLQGFPDSFSFSNCTSISSLREMIGNAVPPAFVATVLKRFIDT